MRAALMLVAIGSIGASAAGAQTGPPLPRLSNEARVDFRSGKANVVEAGWGFIIPASTYMRTTLTAATGYARRDQKWMRESRYEITARFLLDPFRESRYGLSLGGGIGLTNSAGVLSDPDLFNNQSTLWRFHMAAIADLELKKTAGWTPAVQIGLGGGIRAGFLMRSSTTRWR